MIRRLPPLNALRAFEASARLGSFVAAALELHVSAAAVSQQVRRLEKYLDTTLFHRLARGVVLTDQGRDYLPELSAAFDLLGESTARLRAKRADGLLTVTMLAAFANGWLLPRLHRFRERAPRIDLVLKTSRAVLDFRRDAVDLAIRLTASPGRGLQGEILCREELFPVASPTLFRGGRMPDTLSGADGLSAPPRYRCRP
jgi:LysR family glycine cleavage system transcriptional activator